MVFVGLISYALYMWHWPLLSFAYIANVDDAQMRVLLVALSVLLAWATYTFLEVPIRSKTGGRSPARLMFGLFVTAVLGVTTLVMNGAPFRIPAAVRAVADFSFDPTTGARMGKCWLTERQDYNGFAPECLGPAKDAIFVWGDSQAGRLYPSLRELLPSTVPILESVRSGCAPIPGGANRLASRAISS
jgi:SGNH domain (fused to AT3 domains)